MFNNQRARIEYPFIAIATCDMYDEIKRRFDGRQHAVAKLYLLSKFHNRSS